MPLELRSPETFAAARRTLDASGYTEEGLAEPPGPDDPKGLLASLFLQAAVVERDRAESLLGAEGFAALSALGLLEEADGDRIRAGVLLYPLRGLHIASDFPGRGDQPDFVFPAISTQTLEYLSIIPEAECEALLEIGTGSGAAALVQADFAAQVTAGDISPRCLHFAEFNRRLNDIDNVRIVDSDVFDGLDEGATFDRIIAHPPYVPWTGKQEIYRHGGADGEFVLRKLLAGLRERLRPGGRLYAATMGCDTDDGPLEYRVREMLGDGADELDILVVEREILQPMEFILPWSKEENMSFEDAHRLNEAFRERGIQRLVRCSLAIARRTDDGEPLTQRRKAGLGTSAEDLDALLNREAEPAWLDWAEWMERRPRLAPGVLLESAAEAAGGEWRAYSRVLRVEKPFSFRTDCPQWAADALVRLDGQRPLGELLAGQEIDEDEGEIFLQCLEQAGVIR